MRSDHLPGRVLDYNPVVNNDDLDDAKGACGVLAFTDEVLRFDPPVQSVPRIAGTDVDVHGTHLSRRAPR